MTLKDYYTTHLPDEKKTKLRDDLMDLLEIQKSAFYNKIKNNKFTKPEKQAIAQFLNKNVKTLFPDCETNKIV